MAQLPHDARQSLEEAGRHESAAARIETPLLRFGLKQLLGVFALLSTLLACIVLADGITATVVLLATLVVVAHVFGTSLGSRLRARSDEQHFWRGDKVASSINDVEGSRHSAGLRRVQTAGRSPWHGRGSTPLPWLRRLIVGGAMVGGVAGAIILIWIIGHRASFSGILLGSVSLAVLGGWFSFLGGSFYGIFRHGIRDAVANARSEPTNAAFRN